MVDDSNSMFKDNETDLNGFDGLWDVGYKETQKFIQLKKTNAGDKQDEEIRLLQKELEEKEFDIQKLEWQLSEREKELKKLYDELHRLIELNKKLNSQLSDFEKLSETQEKMLMLLGKDPKANPEPTLPSFN